MTRREGARSRRHVVVVRGSRHRPPDPPDPPDPPGPPGPPGRPGEPAAPGTPKPVLGLPVLLKAAVKEAARLEKQPRWTIALKGAAPDQPLLVQRLDRPGQYYAIVAFRFGARLSARIRLDAHDARPGAAMGIDSARSALAPFRTADDARLRMLSPVAPPPGATDGAGEVVVDPFLVWRPCLQSPNAFMPFYRLRRKARQAFYRIDGEFFDELSVASGV